MGFLILLAVIIVIVGGPLGWYAWTSRPKPGQTEMVLLASAAGEAEVELWQAALRHQGIRCHVVNLSVPTTRYTSPDAYELWVPAKDEERARRALGFDR